MPTSSALLSRKTPFDASSSARVVACIYCRCGARCHFSRRYAYGAARIDELQSRHGNCNAGVGVLRACCREVDESMMKDRKGTMADEVAFQEALVRNAPDYMLVLDALGRVEFASRPDHPLLTRPLLEPDVGRMPDALRDAVGRVAQTGTSENVEVCIAQLNGDERWYRAVMKRVDGLRKDPCVLLFLGAITECHEANEALRKTVRELEESRRHMLPSQTMESSGRLAGGIAHDLNNLLTTIISFSRLVMDDFAPGDPRRSDLVEVLKAADSAARLTNQSLAFSRKRPVEPVLMDLNASVRHLSEVLRRTLDESIKLCVVESPAPVCVMFDPGQLAQLLMNVAVNARDAMADGGSLTVAIGTRRIERHRELITDTGTGMTSEVEGGLERDRSLHGRRGAHPRSRLGRAHRPLGHRRGVAGLEWHPVGRCVGVAANPICACSCARGAWATDKRRPST